MLSKEPWTLTSPSRPPETTASMPTTPALSEALLSICPKQNIESNGKARNFGIERNPNPYEKLLLHHGVGGGEVAAISLQEEKRRHHQQHQHRQHPIDVVEGQHHRLPLHHPIKHRKALAMTGHHLLPERHPTAHPHSRNRESRNVLDQVTLIYLLAANQQGGQI